MKSTSAANSEKTLASFINKFDPKHRSLIRSVRTELHKRFPTVNELAYDITISS